MSPDEKMGDRLVVLTAVLAAVTVGVLLWLGQL
jgi:hypothetical protein